MILLRVSKLPDANQHLPKPFVLDEVLRYEGESPKLLESNTSSQRSFNKQFIKVFRLKDKTTHVLRRVYFIDIKTKKAFKS